MVRRWMTGLAVLLLAACAAPSRAGPEIRVEKAWARPTIASSTEAATATPAMPGMAGSDATSAAYFVIVNDGDAADALTGAAADVAATAEVHETRIVADVAQMAPVTRVAIPAHGRVEFKPGGYHVMLDGLKRDLRAGETFRLTLQFEATGTVTVDVPVQPEPPG